MSSAPASANDTQSHAAMASAVRMQEAFESGDRDALATLWHPRLADASGICLTSPRLLVAHGDRAALLRGDIRSPGAERPVLAVVVVDDAGRFTDWSTFDVGDRRFANLELERLAPAATEHDTAAWRAASRLAVATNERDWDAYAAALAPAHRQHDRRPAMSDPANPIDNHRVLFRLDDVAYERTAVAFHGDRRVLCREVFWFRDGAVEDAEVMYFSLVEVDDAGLVTNQTSFGADDLEAALGVLHADDDEVRSTRAWQAVQRLADAVNAHDWDALMACIAPGFEILDRSRSITAPMMAGTDPVAAYRLLFSLDDWSTEITPIGRHGDRRVLVRELTWFRDGAVAASDVESLVVVEIDGDAVRR
jgi:hypothetical protein